MPKELPIELYQNILKYSKGPERSRLSEVSKNWNREVDFHMQNLSSDENQFNELKKKDKWLRALDEIPSYKELDTFVDRHQRAKNSYGSPYHYTSLLPKKKQDSQTTSTNTLDEGSSYYVILFEYFNGHKRSRSVPVSYLHDAFSHLYGANKAELFKKLRPYTLQMNTRLKDVGSGSEEGRFLSFVLMLMNAYFKKHAQ